ncbi:hypothetical protein [Actinoallomurus iriomotensis]|uniref:Uncharacterized protein n=1 Tax=Actinoallomurus iriomotensis TaxID=478107 RepID=A0A9W6S5V3_9ACTN|nr:hypothetical protein [Actinoallomurus iriomotensis]GLY89201.1 hypothetical protein Airi02_071300 [Actinoallomurus iriomotensis]
MLHITLGPERAVDPKTDELGRDRVGFSETMSELALYDANHGCWKLGSRAAKEQFAIVSYGGIVRQAIEIDNVVPIGAGGRSVINGRILHSGHPVYDRYVGKESPVQGVRNPVSYVDVEMDGRPCRCGCGGSVVGHDFLPGHDQAALHARIKQIGTVAEFLDWFDTVRGNKRVGG